jgi:hypothetical protein
MKSVVVDPQTYDWEGDAPLSSTVKDLIAGAGIRFIERGVHVLKGVPGEWRFFAANV